MDERQPVEFQWQYNFEPEPGPRVWKRNGRIWTEQYPSGHTNIFNVVGRDAVRNNQGTVCRILNGSLEAFIPDCGSKEMWLWYRDENTRPWENFMGAMEKIDADRLKKEIQHRKIEEEKQRVKEEAQHRQMEREEKNLREQRQRQEAQRKNEEQEKKADFQRALIRLKEARCSSLQDPSTLNKSYQDLENTASQYKSTEFYFERGEFYYTSAQKDQNSTRRNVMYDKALRDYRQALNYDPFAEGVTEKIEAIESLLRSSKQVGSNPSILLPTSKATNQLPKREELTPVQLKELEEIKEGLRQQKISGGKK